VVVSIKKSRGAETLAKYVNEDVTVRWGYGKHLNGYEQLVAFHDAGLACPEFTLNIDEANLWVGEGNIVFGRRFKHTGGKDIVQHTHRRWFERDYWVKYIPTVDEWRIHVFEGKSIARGVKVCDDPSVPYIRSRRLGWRIVHNIEPPKGIRTFAKRMVAAVGYPYGACDIGVMMEDTFMAFEVNAMPGLDDYTAQAYGREFNRVAV